MSWNGVLDVKMVLHYNLSSAHSKLQSIYGLRLGVALIGGLEWGATLP